MVLAHELVASLWTTALTFSHLLGGTPNGRSLNALILVVGFFILLLLAGSRVREMDDQADRLFALAFFAATCTYSALLGARLAVDVMHAATGESFRPYLSSFTIVAWAFYLVLLGAATLRVGSNWKRLTQRKVFRIAGAVVAVLLVGDRLSRVLSGPGGAPLSGSLPRPFHFALHGAEMAIAAGVVAVLAVRCRPLRKALLFSWILLLIAEVSLAGEHLANQVWATDASLVSQLAFLFHVPGLFLAMASRDRRQLFAALRRIRRQFADVLVALLNFEEVSDAALRRHSQRHADLALGVARRLRMSRIEAEEVFWAALLHDIGKLSLDRELLSLPRPLTADEWVLVRQHPVLGAKVIEDIPGLERVGEYIRHHHERWDGTGYPDALRGNAIPLGSRIIAVVDAFDAMLSRRPYRRPRTLFEGIEEIRRQAAKHFDPAVVAAFLGVLEESGVPVVEET
jgi:putative nucleotidyltransferase with HDIG domain